MRERRCDKVGALQWLEGEGMIEPREKHAKTFYDYTDEHGAVVFRVERLGKGHAPPFLQHGPDGRGGFICRKGCMNGVRKVPYRLDRLVKADPSAVVFWTEGEKDCDRLISLGLVATTNPGGAAKFNGLDGVIAKHFPGRRVVILEDNDEAGAKHVAAGIAALRPHVAAVEGLLLSGLPPKGDVSDWLSAGGTAQELITLAERAFVAADIDVEQSPAANPNPDALPGESGPEQWDGNTPPPRRFIAKDWIVRGSAGLLGGQDGVGKSLLAQQMATCAASGLPFLGIEIEHVKAIYITCEDSSDEMHLRQESINAALGITMASLKGWLTTYSLKGQLGNELGSFDAQGGIVPTKRYEQIRQAALSFGANLIFVDNAAHVFPGNENARHDVAAFLGLLERLSLEIDGAVVLLAHPNKQHAQGNKQGNETSGSTGWSAHVRNRLFLDWNTPDDGAPSDPDERVLRRSKSNYAARGEEVQFRWHKWAFVRDGDLPANVGAEIAAVARANGENERFLSCLAKLTEERRNVSHSRSAGNYAPKVMAAMPSAGGMKARQFEAALNRLLHLQAVLAAQPLWKGADRKPVLGLAINPEQNGVREGAGRFDEKPQKTARIVFAETCGTVRDGEVENGGKPCGTVGERGCSSISYLEGAALGDAAPIDEGERGWSKSGPSRIETVSPDLGDGPDDDLDANGNILGWDN
ncbi:AAA family ATPase [Sphingobium sp. AS12]|uniref:AAA family ATPase n=1 Tax=Sphingobium sp. AS12 TaxID=2849495 RepID=UPI001C31C899|nr:AAA family ATPase [Sphingobium sp. AS12]MBV2147441.1 AAA family ATPase [Sphingobium sp. AS12]